MAEINIQRKSASAIWWVVGLIALLLLVWWLVAAGTNEPRYGGLMSAPDGAVAVAVVETIRARTTGVL